MGNVSAKRVHEDYSGFDLSAASAGQAARLEVDSRGKIIRSEPQASSPQVGEYGEFMQLAGLISQHGGPFVPAHLKGKGEVLSAMLWGRELGLGPMQSLRSIHVIKGKPGLDYSVQVGLLKRHGYRIQWHRQDSEAADCTLHAPDGTHFRKSYTMQDAQKAGLWASSDPWKKHPHVMLSARLIGFMCRTFAAEIFSGVYSSQELQDEHFEEMPAAPAVDAQVLEAPKRAFALVEAAAAMKSRDDVVQFVEDFGHELSLKTEDEKAALAPVINSALKVAGVKGKDFKAMLSDKVARVSQGLLDEKLDQESEDLKREASEEDDSYSG